MDARVRCNRQNMHSKRLLSFGVKLNVSGTIFAGLCLEITEVLNPWYGDDEGFQIAAEDFMVAYLTLAFLAGGFIGMMGMALLACGPKKTLLRDNRILQNRIAFLERQKKERQFHIVRDPRPKVHALVN